ncbi:MAG: hypothetical protein K2V38_28855, partial [Gemmataceae bacterium]|nr:hypothetical protein [Gemmataceae bacterium]
MSGSLPSRRPAAKLLAVPALAVALAALATGAADPPVPAGKQQKETLVGGVPLFAGWPKGKAPDAVLVLTGQTHGYLQPCGCSRPQFGGLERRAYFIETLRAKGWPVAGLDLGDIHPESVAVRDQGQLKYLATMTALREMGYVAVGVGETDISANLLSLLSRYALQPPNDRPPFTLAGNAVGFVGGKQVPRAEWFAPPPGANRPLVGLTEVADVGKVQVGVAGVVGHKLIDTAKSKKLDPALDFTPEPAALKAAATELGKHPRKPQLSVLIYQGPAADAEKVAKDFPQFAVILCQATDPLPPLKPKTPEGTKTLIVEVGTRGQNVGVLGAFRKPDGGFEFHYQLVPMGEEYDTPGTDAEAFKKNKALAVLQEYANNVKADIRLGKDYPRAEHPAQIHAGALKPPVKLTYVGSEACKACHQAEFAVWANAKDKHAHSVAMTTLEKYAQRPNLRQFDGECVKCHSVGFDHRSGFAEEKTTPHLRHVGC